LIPTNRLSLHEKVLFGGFFNFGSVVSKRELDFKELYPGLTKNTSLLPLIILGESYRLDRVTAEGEY